MANTNVASLLNPNILNNIKNSQGIRTFGDQQTNTNQQTQISGNTPTLTNLLQTKKSLIQEEIDLDLKHQQKLLQLQQITPSSLTTDNLPYPKIVTVDKVNYTATTDLPEEILKEWDKEYINFYNNFTTSTGRVDDGFDEFYYTKKDKIPKITIQVSEWRISVIGDVGNTEKFKISEYPTIESIYNKFPKRKEKVEKGIKAITRFDGEDQIVDNEAESRFSDFVKFILMIRNKGKIKTLPPELPALITPQ